MLVTKVTKQHNNYGSHHLCNSRIDMKKFYKEFYKNIIDEEIHQNNHKIPE
jgi:hypothetical protein